jgi:hypothetical protein
MPVIDINSPVGMLRLRLGDTRDVPILPDEVIQQALDTNNGNMKAATKLCGQYILATLAFDSQQSLGVITVYGNQVFNQYKEYLMMVVKDPNFSSISPIPYGGSDGCESPIVRFTKDWHMWENYYLESGGFVKVDLT